jgi:uncharacterized membrane protein YhiD involved in acid resistance
MVSFLLIISFLLHLVTIAALYQLIKKVQKIENESNDIDIVVALERSLEEIKKENNRFERLLKERDKETSSHQKEKKNVKNTDEVSAKNDSIQQKTSNQNENLTHLLGESPGYEVEASIESQVLKLYQEGQAVETIAKQLDIGKREVELIIKMYAT